jgi:ring-1,2-phenylacetyl-CoA epoxidase subunit PaaC
LNNPVIDFSISLADNALILGHRNSEWCGHGPILEQDIAITNIALDLIGQARNFYQYAAQIINQSVRSKDSNSPPLEGQGEVGPASEDTLAYLRDVREFKNCLLTEQPNGDWARTILRQFFFSSYQYYLYQQLQYNNDGQLAAIAAKAIKEVTYHLRWSSEWVIRLGDGTEESHQRMIKAIDKLWPYIDEFFIPADYERQISIDLDSVRVNWDEKVKTIFNKATLIPPSVGGGAFEGKTGTHSEHLGHILSELQFMQRAYPGGEW